MLDFPGYAIPQKLRQTAKTSVLIKLKRPSRPPFFTIRRGYAHHELFIAICPRRLGIAPKTTTSAHHAHQMIDATHDAPMDPVLMQPIVSVIVPFRGAEPELRRCFRSLELQTAKRFEVIVVADAIPLNHDLLHSLRASHIPHRAVINKHQLGPFASRRKGARLSSGKYLWFKDHDDTADPNFIEQMLSAAETNSCDVVECPISIEDESGTATLHKRFLKPQIVEGTNILRNYLNGNSNNSLANKLISRQLWFTAMDSIGTLPNKKLIFAEDLLCVTHIYANATRYCCIEATSYHYKYRETSTTRCRDALTVKQSAENLNDILENVHRLLTRKCPPDNIKSFYQKEVSGAIQHLRNLSGNPIQSDLRTLLGSLHEKYIDQAQSTHNSDATSQFTMRTNPIRRLIKNASNWPIICYPIKIAISVIRNPKLHQRHHIIEQQTLPELFNAIRDNNAKLEEYFEKLLTDLRHAEDRTRRLEAEMDKLLAEFESIRSNQIIYDKILQNFSLSLPPTLRSISLELSTLRSKIDTENAISEKRGSSVI